MPSFLTAHRGEADAMPRVFQINLPEPAESEAELPAIRLESQTERAEHLYMASWIEDHRRRFRRALEETRAVFFVRMEAICTAWK